jgi:hypothetical protein
MVYNKSDFLKHIDRLKPDGFERAEDLPVFKRVELDRELAIQISTREYFPHGVYVSGVIAEIKLVGIEKIYREILSINTLPDKVLQSENTLGKVLSDVQGVDYTVLEEEIKDEASSKRVGQIVREIIESGAMPFFNKFKTASDVNESTRMMDIEELANFIGQPLPFRQMIIKRLSNDPGYSEYVQMVIDFYKTEGDLIQLKFAKDLKDRLS